MRRISRRLRDRARRRRAIDLAKSSARVGGCLAPSFKDAGLFPRFRQPRCAPGEELAGNSAARIDAALGGGSDGACKGGVPRLRARARHERWKRARGIGRESGRSSLDRRCGTAGRSDHRHDVRVCPRPPARPDGPRARGADHRQRPSRGRDDAPPGRGRSSRRKACKRREELDAETESIKRGLREHERRLEKRSDLLDQKLELLTQKDNEIAAGQRALAGRARRATQSARPSSSRSSRCRSRRSRASRGCRRKRRASSC